MHHWVWLRIWLLDRYILLAKCLSFWLYGQNSHGFVCHI